MAFSVALMKVVAVICRICAFVIKALRRLAAFSSRIPFRAAARERDCRRHVRAPLRLFWRRCQPPVMVTCSTPVASVQVSMQAFEGIQDVIRPSPCRLDTTIPKKRPVSPMLRKIRHFTSVLADVVWVQDEKGRCRCLTQMRNRNPGHG